MTQLLRPPITKCNTAATRTGGRGVMGNVCLLNVVMHGLFLLALAACRHSSNLRVQRLLQPVAVVSSAFHFQRNKRPESRRIFFSFSLYSSHFVAVYSNQLIWILTDFVYLLLPISIFNGQLFSSELGPGQ